MCRILFFLFFLLLLCCPPFLQAQAVVLYNVNRTDQDLPDSNPGDGQCQVAGGGCTLRAVIMELNAQVVFGTPQYYALLPLGADILIDPPSLPVILRNLGIQVNAPNAFMPPPVALAQRPRLRAGYANMSLLSVGANASLALRDVELAQSRQAVTAPDSSVIAQRVTFRDNLGIEAVAVDAFELVLQDSLVLDNINENESIYAWCQVIRAQSLQMQRSRVAGSDYIGNQTNRFALCAGSDALIEDSEITGNSHHAILTDDMVLRRSTVSHHPTGAAVIGSARNLRLENVTLSGNAVGLAGTLREDFETIEIVGSTFYGNDIDVDLEKHIDFTGGTLHAFGSALSNCSFPAGLIRATNHYNLGALTGGCLSGETNRIGDVESAFAPLALNEGPLPTHAPLPGSLALDNGPPSPAAGCLEHDARSFPRPVDGDGNGLARCDIGAIEAGGERVFGHGFED